MANKSTTKAPAVNNTLGKLILDSLQKADGSSVPESTLRTGLKDAVRPEADDDDFTNAFQILVGKEVARFETDRVTGERKFFLTELGRNYLRDI